MSDDIRLYTEEDYKPLKYEPTQMLGPSINIRSDMSDTSNESIKSLKPKKQHTEPDINYDQSDAEMFSKVTNSPVRNQVDNMFNTPMYETENEDDNDYETDYEKNDVEEEDEDEDNYPKENYHPQTFPNFFQKQQKSLSQAEIKAKKAHLIWKYNKLNKNGQYSSVILDMDCELDFIESEYIRLEKQIENESGTDLVKQAYIATVAGMEFFSTRQKLVSLNLTNWSYKVAIECNEAKYEKVFSKIYEQYLSSVEHVDPLLSLAFMTVMSAAQFHYSNNPVDQAKQATANILQMDGPDDDDLDSIMSKLDKQNLDLISEPETVASLPKQEEPKPVQKKRGRPKKK